MSEQPDDPDEVLSLLEEIEARFRRMIAGVIRFVFVRLPIWVYELGKDFFDWLGRAIRYAFRLTIKLIRIACLATIWFALVFGPLTASLYMVQSLQKSPSTSRLAAKKSLASAPQTVESGGLSKWHILGASWAVIGLIGSAWSLRTRLRPR